MVPFFNRRGVKGSPLLWHYCLCMAVTALATALVAWPGLGQAGVEEEIAELRREMGEIRRDLSEMKSILQGARQARTPPSAVPQVGVSGRPSLGAQTAPVTMVEFSDYQCPFCKRHFSTVFPILKKEYIDTGKLRYVFRDFPIAGLHPQAKKAHEAAHCAREQKRYWEMHSILFENSKDLSLAALKRYAGEIGLNGDQFDACLESGKFDPEVDKEIVEGAELGVRGTPSFFIGPSGPGEKIAGTMVTGAQPLARFKQIIEETFKVAAQSGESKTPGP